MSEAISCLRHNKGQIQTQMILNRLVGLTGSYVKSHWRAGMHRKLLILKFDPF